MENIWDSDDDDEDEPEKSKTKKSINLKYHMIIYLKKNRKLKKKLKN